MKPASPSSGKRIFGLSPWLLLGVSIVLAGVVLVLAIRNFERERAHIQQNYLDRAEALIWALEAGARTEKGPGSPRPLLQALIEETARQSGIGYMSLVNTDGVILAHSDPSLVGGALAKDALPEVLPETVAAFLPDRTGGRHYEVFRGFSPLSAAHEAAGRHRGGMGMGHAGHMSRGVGAGTPPRRDGLEKEAPTSVIFIGFDREPFEDALATDHLNNLVSALIVAGLGLAGFVSLFWAHSFRDSRRKLKDTRALAAEVVASLPLGLITSDPAGNLGMSNEVALAMFHTSLEAVRGRPVKDIPGLDWESVTASLDARGKSLEREMVLSGPDGGRMPVSVGASEIRDDDGRFLGHVFAIRNISEIKRLQREAQKNERLSALGNLAAGVAHEIRNPLSSIKGLAAYIAGKMRPGAPEEEAARTMVLEVDRLNRVVTELLEFAKPGVVKLAEANLDAVISRALRLAEADLKTGGIDASYVPSAEVSTVYVNAEKLTQALLNLFLNAVQAMEPGGRLAVGVEKRSGRQYAILVSDTGHGIGPDALGSIFTPYFTTKSSGTGLGLAIVHQIIEAHGGEVSVHSEPGRGTTFTLLMPL